jgi:capsular polysaccharide biosynthesis protein
MESGGDFKRPFLSGVILQVVYHYRKHLVILGVLSILLSIVFSSPKFITPLFKSTVILYPTASNSISKVLLSDNFNNSKDILEFGEDEQTEQMLQVLNSNKIRDRIISKFNLMEHYGLKKDSRYAMTELFDEYDNNFKFRRTEFMAVKITVLDRDARMAADMANDVAELIDSTINDMQKRIAVKAFQIVEREYLNLKGEIKAKEDSMTVLRQYGVHDYESQAEMFNRQLAMEMAKGNNTGSIQRLESKLTMLAKYGGPYVSLRDALEHEKKQLSELKAKYEEAKVDATQSLPHKFVINTAYKAERKSYPIRWLIVVVSTFSVIFLAIIFFGLFEIFSGNLGDNIKKKSTTETVD